MKVAFAAAILGIVMLAIWFGKFSPAARWSVLPEPQLMNDARTISTHFGIDPAGLKTEAQSDLAKPVAYGNAIHPEAQTILPLALRVTFQKPGAGKVTVRVDSGGRAIYWAAPKGFKPRLHFASDLDAATYAFQFLAGSQAALYKAPVRSAGDESHEQDYEWRKKSGNGRIKVVVQDAVITRAENLATSYHSDDDEDADSGDNNGYWDALDIAFGILSVVVALTVCGFYVLWLLRKVVNHRFPLRFSAAVLAISIVVYAFGSSTANGDTFVQLLFTAPMVLCIVAIGRGISVGARPKWISLEQLCLLAPVSKSTGRSIGAGLLYSPLVLAVPLAIVAAGLFPHSVLLPRNTQLLYSHTPLFDSLNVKGGALLLCLFGFLIPALTRLLRWRWLRNLTIAFCGVLLFADQTPMATGPLLVPLTVGACTFALYWFVYARFDLLAVLVLHVTGGMVLTYSLLAEKRFINHGMTIAAAIVCASVAAYLMVSRGKEFVEGDPDATHPALAGFRAEREKLRAEFSVARRAQQDMLPRNPPLIPGYSIAASCTPSLEVGGDLYDFLKLPDGRIGIGVADVSGKGVPAALYMTLTKGLLAAVSKNNSNLTRIIEEVNRHLQTVTRKKVFVTMALGFLDIERKLLQCVRAGHNPVVWRQASQNTTTLVSPGGLGLGITAGRVFAAQLKVADMPLSNGDAVVFYSDGITEAMNIELEQFGEQRLMEAVERADNLDAAGARDSILGEVRTFLNGVHPQDDMTIVVLRVSQHERMTVG